jgi:hypothetical protein
MWLRWEGVYPPHDPDTEDERIGAPVWHAVLGALENS